MIGKAFDLGHQRAQPDGARWRRDTERSFGGAGEGKGVGNGAVARRAAGKLRTARQIRTDHQTFNAFVDVTEALLQPHDRLAARVKTEVAGLDDAGMDRTDKNPMQSVAFGRAVIVWRTRIRPRMLPFAVIEPRPRIARAVGDEAMKIAHRALEPDRRRMLGADRRKV